jgi:hypothetical protein
LLSAYHKKFIKVLHQAGVDFLIVGGQAGFLHFGKSTKDLDIWAPIDGDRASKLEQALKGWISKHPMHNDAIAYAIGPLALRLQMQIHIPMDDAWYEGDDGETLEIKVEDGIDILTSMAEMVFDDCFARSNFVSLVGCSFRYFSVEDLESAMLVREQSERPAK